MPETGNNIVTTKPTLDLIDETFDISQSASYHLSIQTSPGRLAFCIFNSVLNKYLVLRYYQVMLDENTCKNIFENDDLLGLVYKGCNHVFVSHRYTLVPASLFDQGASGFYLDFNQNVKSEEQVMSLLIRPAQAYDIYACPEWFKSLLVKYQPSVAYFHHVTPFIDSLLTDSAKAQVAVYYYGNHMDVAITKQKQLLFYNTFKIETLEEAVYYLAGALNMSGMSIAATTLTYSKDVNETLPLANALKKYVARLVEYAPMDTVTYTHYISEQIKIQFAHLFNLYRCAL